MKEEINKQITYIDRKIYIIDDLSHIKTTNKEYKNSYPKACLMKIIPPKQQKHKSQNTNLHKTQTRT